jgi:hypothetical protein
MNVPSSNNSLPTTKAHTKIRTDLPVDTYLSSDIHVISNDIEEHLVQNYNILANQPVLTAHPAGQHKKKYNIESSEEPNEKDFDDDMSGSDLDVPGSELDDQQESVGSEDEENNYYSLGGDDHNDLEEDRQ